MMRALTLREAVVNPAGLSMRVSGQVAQSVEQGIENPRVGGSIPSLATIHIQRLMRVFAAPQQYPFAAVSSVCRHSSRI